MAFGWVIRHQKKALFILAAALVVGWGLGSFLQSLLSERRGTRAGDVIARIAGQDVTAREFGVFRANWSRVFPELLSSEALARMYPGQKITSEEMAWAWYGLLTMARQAQMEVPDEFVLRFKRERYQGWIRRQDAVLDDAAEEWFRKHLGMSGQNLDEIIRQLLMAHRMLSHIVEGLQATEAEAWEQYAKENRAVRVRYVAFPADNFLAKAKDPDNETVQAYFEYNPRAYYRQPTVQIEYVQLLNSKLEAGVAVTTDDMKKYYEDNKQDLYKIQDAKEGKEAEYLPFPEVKPEIEETLKRKVVTERAAAIMDAARAAFEGAPEQATLEDVVKALNQPAVEVLRTPFLTDVHLLELPGIGVAHAEGLNIALMAFDPSLTPRKLSPVLTSADGRWMFRLMAPKIEGVMPELAEVRERVVADVRRSEALTLAYDAAAAFDNAVVKAGGAAGFEAAAAGQKLEVKETPFFLNNLFDVSRPDFIERMSPLDLGALYGPWVSTRDAEAAVVKVIDERAADRAGFAGEQALKRDYVLASKAGELPRQIVPRALLKFAGFENLTPPKPPEEDNSTDDGS